MIKNSILVFIISMLVSCPFLAGAENAADYYKQAFELYEEPNDIEIGGFVFGESELSPEIEQFLEEQVDVIDLLIKASEIDYCDWQFDPFGGEELFIWHPYIGKVKNIGYLQLAYIRYKEQKGIYINIESDFKPIFRLMENTGTYEIGGYLVNVAVLNVNITFINEYLNRHPDHLLSDLRRGRRFLEEELSAFEDKYKNTFNGEIEFATKYLTNFEKYIYTDKYLTERMCIDVTKLDADFFERNLKFYKDYMIEFKSFLSLPYPDAIKKYETMEEKAMEQFRDCLPENKADSELFRVFEGVDSKYVEGCDCVFMIFLGNNPKRGYLVDIGSKTSLNALMAGIDLLIEYRAEKRLPDVMPEGYPKDLFGDKAFGLVKTTKGFKLKSVEYAYPSNSKARNIEMEFVLPKD